MLMKRIISREKIDQRFRGALHVAIGLLDWLLPENETEVGLTSNSDENPNGKFPEELKDPFAALDRDKTQLR